MRGRRQMSGWQHLHPWLLGHCFSSNNCLFVMSPPPGWYVVWHLFLSKFKFLRELVGDASTPQTEKQPPEIRKERTPPALTRSRPRSARQRVAFPDATS